MNSDATKRRSAIDVRGLDTFLKELGQFLGAIGSATEDYSLTWGFSGDVYHYTSLEGFKGITQSHDLYLTHSRFSNDEEEMKRGDKTARDVIDAARTKSDRPPDWLPYLDQVEDHLNESLSVGVYICCFCQEDDLLSQWRSYGANGAGVSIAFDANAFKIVTGPDALPESLTRVWKVFYERDQQIWILEEAISYAFNSPGSLEERARRAADYIEFFIPTFKNQGFSEEKEVRLIFTPPKDFELQPEFRVTRGMLVPYYSLKELIKRATGDENSRLPITGVRVGPSANKILNVESALMLLQSQGYDGIIPGSSETLYRA